MFTGKRILVAWGVLLLLGLPASAADRYTSFERQSLEDEDDAPRQVRVYRGKPKSIGSARLAQHQNIPPVPDPVTDDDAQPEQIQAGSPSMQYQGDASMFESGGGSCGSCGGCGACDQCGGGCMPAWIHRSYFFADYLYLRATNDNVAHAIQQNGVGGPGTTPNGRVGVVDSNHQGGFRTGFGFALDNCSSIGLTYTNYMSHATDSLSAGTGLGDTVSSLVLHPATVNAGSTSSLVQASHDIDFRTVDFDYRRMAVGGYRGAINYTVGVRYGKLGQDFLQLGNFTPPVGTIRTTTHLTWEGVGFRTGLDGQRQLGASRLSAYGKSFINVLFGQANSAFTQFNTTTSITQATSNWRDERVVPVLEYEVGLKWTSCSGCLSYSAGYYTAFWFNAITTPEYIQAVQTANFVGLGQTVAFDGFVSRLEYRF